MRYLFAYCLLPLPSLHPTLQFADMDEDSIMPQIPA